MRRDSVFGCVPALTVRRATEEEVRVFAVEHKGSLQMYAGEKKVNCVPPQASKVKTAYLS